MWRLETIEVPQALGTLDRREATWALARPLLCKCKLLGFLVFVLLVELGWLPPGLQVKIVFRFQVIHDSLQV